jgi:hypothetical protein
MKSEPTEKNVRCDSNERTSEVSIRKIGEDGNGERKIVAGHRSSRTCSELPLGDMDTKSE